ncbi:hypothetical protein COTS27_01079 [Spirochaetota bacterium]|nr:hypothetical protein COTS27_01079 [Spirochaetota bacterium]
MKQTHPITIPSLRSGETARFLLETEAATRAFATIYTQKLNGNEIIIVSGAMGSGKSFLIRSILETLAVDATHLPSPTFTIIHPYQYYVQREPTTEKEPARRKSLTKTLTRHVFHIDLYRIKHVVELTELGILEILDGNNLVFIEWGEKFPLLIDRASYHLSLNLLTAPHKKQSTISPKKEPSSLHHQSNIPHTKTTAHKPQSLQHITETNPISLKENLAVHFLNHSHKINHQKNSHSSSLPTLREITLRRLH